MSTNYLIEAFKELELLDTVDTNKEDKLTGTFEFDKKGAEDLGKFMEDDTFNDFETVIDPEATTEEELQDSYIGMGILGCDICHSMIYKPIEEIVIDDETQMANVGECCPYCYERDGFKIIGKVAPFEEISVEVEKTEDGEEVPEPTVKVNGKDVPVDEAPEKEEEALTAEQKYPVQSPIHESVNQKVTSKRKRGAASKLESFKVVSKETDKLCSVVMDGYQQMFTGTKEECEDWIKSQKGPVSRLSIKDSAIVNVIEEGCKVEEDLSNSEKLFRAFPELREPIKESIKESAIKTIKIPAPYNKYFDILEESDIEFTDGMFKIGEEVSGCKILAYITPKDAYAEKFDDAFLVDADEDTPIVVEIIHDRCYPLELPKDLAESLKSKNLREGMEDISITTDDQVIKVKATPRTDKETIVPVEPKEIEKETDDTAEIDGEDELMDIELDEIDETSFDELGESYLKKVYENVTSFKTISGLLTEDNKLKLEGVIEFNSGKKAKTSFLFEAKEVTRKGQLKFVGLNENLSKNKKAFTLAGSTKDGKLICEQLNYNYLAKDEKSGVSKRLYGTIRK